MTTESRSSNAAARVRAAVEATANALARADLDALLSAEAGLTSVFNDLSLLRSLDPDQCRVLRDELLATQVALARARRLGASLGDYVRLSLEARGQGAGYDPAPLAAATLTGRGFQTRA